MIVVQDGRGKPVRLQQSFQQEGTGRVPPFNSPNILQPRERKKRSRNKHWHDGRNEGDLLLPNTLWLVCPLIFDASLNESFLMIRMDILIVRRA